MSFGVLYIICTLKVHVYTCMCSWVILVCCSSYLVQPCDLQSLLTVIQIQSAEAKPNGYFTQCRVEGVGAMICRLIFQVEKVWFFLPDVFAVYK